MSEDLLDFVGMPDVPFTRYCKPCRRKLRVDVGVSVDGMPSAWAHCSGCGTDYCPVDPRHVLKGKEWSWFDGRTATGEGSRVPCCNEGLCGRLLGQYERMLVVFSSFASGSEAAEMEEALRARALGDEANWVTLAARFMLRVFAWYRVEKRARAAAALTAAPAESMTVEEILASARVVEQRTAKVKIPELVRDDFAEMLAALEPGESMARLS